MKVNCDVSALFRNETIGILVQCTSSEDKVSTLLQLCLLPTSSVLTHYVNSSCCTADGIEELIRPSKFGVINSSFLRNTFESNCSFIDVNKTEVQPQEPKRNCEENSERNLVQSGLVCKQ